MTVTTVHVPLGLRAYDIKIGEGLVADAARFLDGHLNRAKVAIVTDANVGALHLPQLVEGLSSAGIACPALTLPAGEATKNWQALQQVVEWLLGQNIERDDVVIALGGGVIGDLAGFAAAILRRGVRLVQMPTSLLAQVDSSVGGKTGINSPRGKNLIGAFHQPSLVLADVLMLNTLKSRDFLSGYGEVVKYGLLGDSAFFTWLEDNGPALAAGNITARIAAIEKSCRMKADIVVRDETEQGDRALLNLGHTFGHALEAATGYSDRLLHGEGVAIGCALAFTLSQQMGLCPQEVPSRVRQHLRDMQMKTDLSDIKGDLPDAAGLIQLMTQDKKVKDGVNSFVLTRDIGAAFVTSDVDMNLVKTLLKQELAARS